MAEKTLKQKIGRLGEDIAVKYLENKGFTTICLNYRKKCGEIDIIAKKGKNVHFIEVKTVSESPDSESADLTPRAQTLGRSGTLQGSDLNNVPRETDNYRAEDNIHEYKLKRLLRTIQLYLMENFPKGEPEWGLDAIIVRLDIKNKKAEVKYIENVGI